MSDKLCELSVENVSKSTVSVKWKEALSDGRVGFLRHMERADRYNMTHSPEEIWIVTEGYDAPMI